jgi:short-subunit dehydrogenase
VAICARDPQELTRAQEDIERFGIVDAQTCDVTDAEQVRAWITSVSERFGPADIVINNAGVILVGPVQNMSLADFESVMETNFWGALRVIWAVLPQMRERRSGQIVNIASIGGPLAVPHLLPYDCAKAALRSLSEGLNAELARDGIAVTTVIPGLMRTGSPVHGEFKGDTQREFDWFSVSAMSHLSSMDAERAGRRIVRAIKQRESEVVLTWQAKLGSMAQGVLPSVVIAAFRAINRLLPESNGSASTQAGKPLSSSLPMAGIKERLARNAAQFNEGK